MKQPTQKRSKERVAHILKTARSLIDAEGLEGLTTTRIAQAAGVPVGSVYQFFSDRDDLIDALAVEQREVLVDRCRAVLKSADMAGASPIDITHLLVTEYIDALTSMPGAVAVNRYRIFTQPMLDGVAPSEGPMALLHTEVLERVGAEISAAELPRVLQVLISTSSVLIDMALLKEDPQDRALFLKEMVKMLSLYVSHRGEGF